MAVLAQRTPARWATSRWPRFALRRLTRLVISLFLLISAAFGMIHAIPGDPVRAALGLTAPQSLVNAERHTLGLDRPLWQQYLSFLHGVVTGNLGTSITERLPVATIIGQRLPPTAELAALAFLVVLAVAVPAGLGAAAFTRDGRHPRAELAFSTVTGVFGVIPDFLLAVGLVFVFAVTIKAFPVASQGGAASYVLPVAALAAGPAAVLARIVRAETLRVLGEDYMRTARMKRLPGTPDLPAARPAQRADRHPHAVRAAAVRAAGRDGPGREHLRVAGPGHPADTVCADQGLPGRAGPRARLRRRRAADQPGRRHADRRRGPAVNDRGKLMAPRRAPSPWRRAPWRRAPWSRAPWSRALRTPTGGSAAVLVALLVVTAVVAPLVLGGRAAQLDVTAARQGISARHWLGTDGLGRDILARVLVATRLSLELAIAATLVSAVTGVVLGTLPAVAGRTLGRLTVALVNLLVAFPALLLALFLVVIFGVGERGAVLAIGLAGTPGVARFTQTLSASVAGSDYVAAARILGVRPDRILIRHVLPNIAEPLLILGTISVGGALVAFAGLSFLGFGVQATRLRLGRDAQRRAVRRSTPIPRPRSRRVWQ